MGQKQPIDSRQLEVREVHALRSDLRQGTGNARVGRSQYGLLHDGWRS